MLLQSPGHQTYLSRQVERSSNSASLEMKSFFTKLSAKSKKQNPRSRIQPQKSWQTLPSSFTKAITKGRWIYSAGYAGFKYKLAFTQGLSGGGSLALSSINWSYYVSHSVGMTQLHP